MICIRSLISDKLAFVYNYLRNDSHLLLVKIFSKQFVYYSDTESNGCVINGWPVTGNLINNRNYQAGSMKYKLLILDDEQSMLQMLKTCFQSEIELFLESESDAALRRIASERPNVAIIDINLPGKSGLEVLKEAKKIDPGLAVTPHCERASQCGHHRY